MIKLGQTTVEGKEKASMEVEKAKKPIVPSVPKKPKEAKVKEASDPYFKIAELMDKLSFNLQKEALFGFGKKVVQEIPKGPSRLKWFTIGALGGLTAPKIYDWLKRYQELREPTAPYYSPYM